MKILFSPTHYVFDSSEHGSEFFDSYFVVSTLSRRWPDSTVIVGKNIDPRSNLTSVVEVDKSIDPLNVSFIGAISFAIKFSIATFIQLRRDRYKVLHHVRPFLIGSTINPVVLLNLHRRALFVVGPFCSPYESDHGSMSVTIPIKAILRYLSIKTLQRANMIFVYDNYTKSLISDFVDPKLIYVTPPTISDGSHIPINPQKNYQEEINILSVGHLIARKRFDQLINAFDKVAKQRTNITLTIVGEGPERERLETILSEKGLNDKVKLAGNISNTEIGKYYAIAHLFVCFQSAESFGKVYVEAMASGLPIITSENVGSRQIVTSDIGILVQTGDIDGLAAKMSMLLDDRNLMKKMSENAYATFLKKYEQSPVSKNYITAYEQLIRDS